MGLLSNPEDMTALAGLLMQIPDRYGQSPFAGYGQYLSQAPERKKQQLLQNMQMQHLLAQTKEAEAKTQQQQIQNQGLSDANLALQNQESLRQAGLLSQDATPEGKQALSGAMQTQNAGLLSGAAISGDKNLLDMAQQISGVGGGNENMSLQGQPLFDSNGNIVAYGQWSSKGGIKVTKPPEGMAFGIKTTPTNLGGSVVNIPNIVPSNMLPKTYQKTPPPQDMPEFKGNVESAVKGAEIGAKRQQSMQGIGEIIDQARNVLTGAKTDSNGRVVGVQELPTHSGLGSVIDKATSFIGVSPTGAKQATALDSLAGALVAKMPRMEGPQSNYDVENYNAMAGRVGDRTLPIDQRLEALKNVEMLWRKYETGGQNVIKGQSTGVKSRPPLSAFQR